MRKKEDIKICDCQLPPKLAKQVRKIVKSVRANRGDSALKELNNVLD